MKRKIFSTLFALVLVLTLGLVTAVPAAVSANGTTFAGSTIEVTSQTPPSTEPLDEADFDAEPHTTVVDEVPFDAQTGPVIIEGEVSDLGLGAGWVDTAYLEIGLRPEATKDASDRNAGVYLIAYTAYEGKGTEIHLQDYTGMGYSLGVINLPVINTGFRYKITLEPSVDFGGTATLEVWVGGASQGTATLAYGYASTWEENVAGELNEDFSNARLFYSIIADRRGVAGETYSATVGNITIAAPVIQTVTGDGLGGFTLAEMDQQFSTDTIDASLGDTTLSGSVTLGNFDAGAGDDVWYEAGLVSNETYLGYSRLHNKGFYMIALWSEATGYIVHMQNVVGQQPQNTGNYLSDEVAYPDLGWADAGMGYFKVPSAAFDYQLKYHDVSKTGGNVDLRISVDGGATWSGWKLYQYAEDDMENLYPLTHEEAVSYGYAGDDDLTNARVVSQIFVCSGTTEIFTAAYYDIQVDVTPYPLSPRVKNVDTGKGYTAIQLAVDAPETLDTHTISVAAGTYNLDSPIVVDESVTITGDIATPSNVVVNAPTGGVDMDCFQVKANNVTIQGFLIQGALDAASGAGAQNAGVMIGTHWVGEAIKGLNNIDISHNEFVDCSKGIFMYHVKDSTVSYNHFTTTEGETIDNFTDTKGWGGDAVHVYLWDESDYPTGNTISHNNMDNVRVGVFLNADHISGTDPSAWDFSGTTIEDNTMTNVWNTGIMLQCASGTAESPITIDDNDIDTSTGRRADDEGNERGLINIRGDYTVITGNTLTNSEEHGMWVDGSNHTITGNTVTSNTLDGIHVGAYKEIEPVWGWTLPVITRADITVADNTLQTNTIQVGDPTEALDMQSVLDNNTFDRAVVVDHEGASLLHTIWSNIQDGIDAAVDDDTVNVAAGEYAGAIVDKAVTVSGAPGGASVITSGVEYKAGNPALHSAFRPEADGAEIRNFTIINNVPEGFKLGVYAIGVDDLTVDSLTINGGTMQGITNWGGSNWVITNNVITETVTSGGGGIGIFVGAKTTQQCTGNLIQYNTIHATATAETYSCAGIALCLDERSNYNFGNFVDGFEDVSGNQILNNIITSSSLENTVGIEVGTILGNSETDPDRTDAEGIAALMVAGAVHDNLVQDNSIDEAETGVYFYNVTDLTITQNEITNSIVNGIYTEHGHSGVTVSYNNIYGNAFGFEHEDIEGVDYGSIDATLNYWGHASGPSHELSNGKWVGKGDKVSDNVDYKPWLHKSKEKVVGKKEPAYAQSVDLDKTGDYGWNTFSVPIFLDEEANTWAELYDLAELAYSLAYRFDSDTQEFVSLNTTDDYDINPGEGFFIKMDDVGSLSILYSTEENLMPPSRPLTAGWNLIGLANLEDMDVDDAFASIAETSGLAGYSQIVSPTGNVNSGAVLADGTIYVGESYWVYMLGARTLAGFSLTPVDWMP